MMSVSGSNMNLLSPVLSVGVGVGVGHEVKRLRQIEPNLAGARAPRGGRGQRVNAGVGQQRVEEHVLPGSDHAVPNLDHLLIDLAHVVPVAHLAGDEQPQALLGGRHRPRDAGLADHRGNLAELRNVRGVLVGEHGGRFLVHDRAAVGLGAGPEDRVCKELLVEESQDPGAHARRLLHHRIDGDSHALVAAVPPDCRLRHLSLPFSV
jgi:hypothetical protein